MEDILNQIGTSLNGFFKSDAVQFGLRAIGIYLVVIWLATAYWAFRDMQQRSGNPILPYVAAAGIIVFTPIFFLLAVWVYKIVRPHEKIGEIWERNLAEEALLAEVEAIRHCPGCERRIDDEWIICPSCRTRLNRVCPNCSRLVGMDWSLCAFCGRDFERRAAPAAVGALDRGRDTTGRIAVSASPAVAAAPASYPSSLPSASAPTPAPASSPSTVPSSVRTRGRPRPGSKPAASQDPLPER